MAQGKLFWDKFCKVWAYRECSAQTLVCEWEQMRSAVAEPFFFMSETPSCKESAVQFQYTQPQTDIIPERKPFQFFVYSWGI